MSFEFKRLEIPDIILITPKVNEDERGFFMETFKYSEFKKWGIATDYKQDCHSKSNKGVIRGLHYQLNPMAQGKLIRVVKGALVDIVVDIRKNSPHYSKWISIEISAENKNMVWIPPGFAHAICVMADETELLYKVTNEYSPENERGIVWNDSQIGIKWPIKSPSISDKDKKNPLLRDAENNFIYP